MSSDRVQYRRIPIKFWTSPKLKGRGSDFKLVFAWILSGPETKSFGILHAPISAGIEYTELPKKRFWKAFEDCVESGLIRFDKKSGLVVIPNFFKYEPPANHNVVKGYAKQYYAAPQCELLREYLYHAHQILETVSKPFADTLRETVPEPFRNGFERVSKRSRIQDQDQDTGSGSGDSYESLGSDEPPASAPPLEPPRVEVFLTAPCAGGEEFTLTQAKADEWRALYGKQLDVDRELRHAAQWLRDHPSRQKTPRGMAAFFSGWLKRATEPKPPRATPPTPPPADDDDYHPPLTPEYFMVVNDLSYEEAVDKCIELGQMEAPAGWTSRRSATTETPS